MTKHVRRSHSFDLERLKSMVLEAQGLGFSLNEDVGGIDGRCPLFARRCGINDGENLIPAVTAHGSARAPRRGILRSLFHVCDEILRWPVIYFPDGGTSRGYGSKVATPVRLHCTTIVASHHRHAIAPSMLRLSTSRPWPPRRHACHPDCDTQIIHTYKAVPTRHRR